MIVGRCQVSLSWKTRLNAFTEKGYFSRADPDEEARPIKVKKEYNVAKRENMADFIWNRDLDDLIELVDRQKNGEKKIDRPPVDSGFLSIARTFELANPSVDLSDQLKPKSSVQTKINPPRFTKKEYIPPTQKEIRDWPRSTKFATRVIPLSLDEDKQQEAEDSMTKFQQENAELFIWSFGLIGISFPVIYFVYNQEIAWSYLFGAVGGLVYLRLLKKSVEAIGSNDLSSMASQPRLLVPIILAMALNRWNTLAADQVGVTLQLLPILVGFFTYKGAVIGRQTLVYLQQLVSEFKR